MNISEFFLIGFVSMVLTLLLTPLSMKIAFAVDAIDKPDGRKLHKGNIPCLGGLAFAISLGFSCLIFLPLDSIVSGFLIGLIIITITGLADDIWHIRPALKFSGEIIASLVFISYGEVELRGFGDLIGIGPLETGILAVPITIFCMIGVMNAVNLVDGLDGLAGGISAIACLFLGYFSVISGQWLNITLSISLLGCLIGFLYFNYHPARVFMGDTGSLVLGFSLSSICVLSQKLDTDAPIAPISMALILALPIADTLWVMTNRVCRDKSPFAPDNTHLHHKLLRLNLSQPVVVIVLCGNMLICGLLATLMQSMAEWLQFAIGTVFIVSLYLIVALFQRMKRNVEK